MFARPIAFRLSAGDEGNSALRAADMIEIDTAFFCGLDLIAALRAECDSSVASRQAIRPRPSGPANIGTVSLAGQSTYHGKVR